MRNRNVVSGLSLEYLQALHAEYERFIEDISRSIPVIRVNWEQFRDAPEAARVIEEAYLSNRFLTEARWSPTKA